MVDPLAQRIKTWDIDQKIDERGFFELLVDGKRIQQEEFGSLIVAAANPGFVRGNHYHKINTDFLVIVQGRGLCGFRDANTNERYEIEVSGNNPKLIFIPTEISHAVKNVGDELLIFVEYSSLTFKEKVEDIYPLDVL